MSSPKRKFFAFFNGAKIKYYRVGRLYFWTWSGGWQLEWWKKE